jgi:hypothetical protein
LNIEKIAEFAPMPSANERTATIVTNGVRKVAMQAQIEHAGFEGLDRDRDTGLTVD